MDFYVKTIEPRVDAAVRMNHRCEREAGSRVSLLRAALHQWSPHSTAAARDKPPGPPTELGPYNWTHAVSPSDTHTIIKGTWVTF